MSITRSDQEEINKLRLQLNDLFRDDDDFGTDFDLLRFLKGSEFRFEKTVESLKEHLLFRRGFNPPLSDCSDISNSPVYPHFGHWIPDPPVYSKQGYVVWAELTGSFDMFGMARTSEHCCKDLFDYHLKVTEVTNNRVRAIEERTGTQSGQYIICDLSNFRYKSVADFLNAAIQFVRPHSEFVSRHYVEVFSKIVAFNAPPVLYAIWQVIQYLVPRRTRENVIITSPRKAVELLLEDIGVANLPKYFGGELEISSSEFHCSEDYDPAKFFDKGRSDMSRFTSHLLPSGGTLVATVSIDELSTPTAVHYTIFVDSSFHFGAFYKETDGPINLEEDETLIPVYKPLPLADSRPEWGQLNIDRTGFYKLYVYNNNYRFQRAITVELKVDCEVNGQNVPCSVVIE